ncbi:MAG: VOC family protein [Planctomycetota bacterium]
MDLGAFSVSLAVKDIEASRAFYAKLGFETIGGDASQNWLILRNGTTTVGLFQGMFEKNIMTFNPGWAVNPEEHPESFLDIREIQKTLEEQGLEILQRAGDDTGPASFVVTDPDGNPVLLDQHVPRPA